MMKSYLLPLITLFAWSSISLGEQSSHYPLVAIEDGDTITVQVGEHVKRLQLAGIDAPEDQANPKLSRDLERTGLSSDMLLELGNAATAHLKQLISPGDQIQVVGDLTRSDRYGRIPVFVYKDHHSLNLMMVSDGYAVVLSRATIAEDIKTELTARQQQAQAEKRGLWGSHQAAALRWSGQ
ncbi:thermonuclease family protein [Sedimenticola thiotaurini]|uniref:TNase-like domain-containing protein n=1 Tax=Sedimenticola thiotaurini TaxID=1543721 RepID=A0A0F7JV68_9GAMM|nr:thermonuclease family protein [Sedimenticola thiotaurini]AKH20466.1 hypothetical protein AAY24_09005 [Sedimenticola thiotaurini]